MGVGSVRVLAAVVWTTSFGRSSYCSIGLLACSPVFELPFEGAGRGLFVTKRSDLSPRPDEETRGVLA